MMFLDSPSQLAPSTEWQAWRLRLNKLNPHDSTVVAEKLRADRMVALLLEEEELDRQAASTQTLTREAHMAFTLKITAIYRLPRARIGVIDGVLLEGAVHAGCDAELVQGETRTPVHVKSVVLGAPAKEVEHLSVTVDIRAPALALAAVGDQVVG